MSILFIVLLPMVVGCSAQNASEEKNSKTLETVLNETFTVPNKELRDILEDPNNYTIIAAKEKINSTNNLDAYLVKKYKAYFTSYKKFELNLNKALKELENHEIIDVKFAVNNEPFTEQEIYAAVILYKA
ncbi:MULTISPECIES: hypothetical protein [Bacillaceae]|uniref:Lipoprotein n=2 Tax=Bacillales TaxID=1385 RepID=A0ABV1ESI8_9BACI|nr:MULTISPECIES: hypothetical protein [Bacillaceae]CAI9390681.1 hypothetical protein BACSP_00406 [Bacillus sp. T2.9-1]